MVQKLSVGGGGGGERSYLHLLLCKIVYSFTNLNPEMG